MYVDHLQLLDFRSYVHVELPLEAGVTVFVGANGQGKTNLVEAVDYLATLGSHRVSSETPLVRAGTDRALVRARVRAGADDDRAVVLEVEITPGKANRARLNRSPLPRSRDLLGLLRTVIFSPEDLAVVKGDPSERRRFIDDLVVARWPRLAGVRADYDRVLRQRTTLLKSLAGRRGTPSTDALSTLEVWDDHLARLGAEVLHARLTTLAELIPHVSAAYADIAPTNNLATAEYRTAIEWDEPGAPAGADEAANLGGPAVAVGDGDPAPPAEPVAPPAEPVAAVPDRATLAEAIRRRLEARRSDELARGLTLVGPHRDDIVLALGDLPVKGYASHGESWSFALALRLGSFQLLRDDGIEPVLVLDDVFAELDTTRRERLAARVAGAEQVLITAAVVADVPALLRGRQFQVGGGEVHPSTPATPP